MKHRSISIAIGTALIGLALSVATDLPGIAPGTARAAEPRFGSADDLVDVEARLQNMRPLTEKANTTALLGTIGDSARRIVVALSKQNISAGEAQVAISAFVPLRAQVSRLTRILSAYVDSELRALQESTRNAQKVSAWQVAALVPGTLILVLFFLLLVARPIRQIDEAIRQLGQSGFSKPIRIKGPMDLERLSMQLEWLRIYLV